VLFVLIVLSHQRRRSVRVNVTDDVTTEHYAAPVMAKDTTVRWLLTNDICIASVP